jgi:hypothetical protein
MAEGVSFQNFAAPASHGQDMNSSRDHMLLYETRESHVAPCPTSTMLHGSPLPHKVQHIVNCAPQLLLLQSVLQLPCSLSCDNEGRRHKPEA